MPVEARAHLKGRTTQSPVLKDGEPSSYGWLDLATLNSPRP